jgi:hypothetical protein
MQFRKLILAVGLWICYNTICAQQLSPFLNSNYSGISGCFIQPAYIAGNPLKFDMSIAELQGSFSNNLVSYIKPNFYTYPLDSNVLNYNDELKKRVYINGSAALLSFMVRTKNNKGFGITMRTRSITNVSVNGRISFPKDGDVEDTFDDIADPDAYNQNSIIQNPVRLQIKHLTWSELGFNFGKIFSDKKDYVFKGGASVKLLQGIAGEYFKANIAKTNTVMQYNSAIGYASGVLKPFSLGLDVGGIYEHKLKHDDSETDESELNYDYKLGFSILDMGSIKFKNKAKELIDSSFGYNRDMNKRSFSMKLPTSLSFQADFKAYKKLYLNVTSLIALGQNSTNRVYNLSYITFSPRIEGRYAEIASSFTINQMQQFDVGMGFRVGPLWFFSSNLISDLLKKQIYGVDALVVLKLPLIKFHLVKPNWEQLKKDIAKPPMRYLNQEYYTKSMEWKMKPRKQLFKIDFMMPLIKNGTAGIHLIFERKINQAFSYRFSALISTPRDLRQGWNAIDAYARYYYNLKKRMEKNKTGDSFFANYFSAGTLFETWDMSGYLQVLYGLQRSLFKYTYIDINGGFNVASFPGYEFSPTGNIEIGVAF